MFPLNTNPPPYMNPNMKPNVNPKFPVSRSPSQPLPPQPPPPKPPEPMIDKWSLALVAIETLLISMALLPPKVWANLPGMSSSNGPFPAQLAPLIILIIYLLPAIIGFRNPRWQYALLFASLPAWIGLAVFLLVSSVRQGAFYIVASDRISANVSTVELFAALGGTGWLARLLLVKAK